MDKKEKGKVIAGAVLFLLTIAFAAIAAIWIANSGIPEIQLGQGSAAYADFLRAIKMTRDVTEVPRKWIVFGSTLAVYGGGVLFIAAMVLILAKRSARFLFLPISGLCAFIAGAFLLLVFYQVQFALTGLEAYVVPLALGLCIVLFAIGLASFVLSFVFPRRLILSRMDDVLDEESTEPEEEASPADEDPELVIKEEPAAVAEEKAEKKAAKPNAAPKAKTQVEEKGEPVPDPEPEPAPAEAKPRVLGKYEVFPEAGFFKYRLKANNGEILVVSNPYKTKESALAGIETLKKNIPLGNSKIVTDKNGFGQFRIFTGNDSRLVVAGEIYPTAARAENALNSTLKFYATERVNVLDEIPEAEHREWHAFADTVQPSANGKLVLGANEDGKFIATLYANNGELLLVSATYSTKAALKKAIANIREKLLSGDTITIARDKQNRFQFRLYSDNGMLLLMGETYPSRDSAEKALRSARNFIGDARIVEE